MKRKDIQDFFRGWYVGEFTEQPSPNLLTEQDDPFGGDEGGGDEEGGDEGGDDPFAAEGGDEEGGDEAADEGGDEGADEGGDDADKDDAEAKDEGPKAEEEDHVRFGKSLDDQLQAIFVDIEADSIKSAQVQSENYSLRQILLREADEVQIDIDRFAAETARLIKNFDAFFDIEELVYNKARSFLLDKYGEEVADEVAELLDVRHDITEKEKAAASHQEFEETVPIAVGAKGAGGP
tara:strand:+ start:194 stop:901 length:708 start_codon:yes stop_codon:yes gene_type:complete